MNLARVEPIARAVLYEGYNLYPYRPSALKNQQRWTFGSVFPRDWSVRGTGDRCQMRTECLVEGSVETALEVRVRFLQIVAREVGELLMAVSDLPEGEPASRPVQALVVGNDRYFTWEEARERDIVVPALSIGRLLAAPVVHSFVLPDGRDIEPIHASDGTCAGLVIRTMANLNGEITLAAERVMSGAYRVSVLVENVTCLVDASQMPRDRAQRSAFASTHTLLGVQGGAFVSLLDPPAALRDAASICRNEGTWPVLVGEEGEREMLLSSPIILYDYPQTAPESPGDLFDGCEIDEILTLRILTLTEEEKREMAAADPRTRALLDRTEALTAEELAMLHGTFRAPRNPTSASQRARDAAQGLRAGDRVRLKPKSGGDVMDIILRDQVAVIEAIEHDFEGRAHVAVTLLDDPGRDLGMARMPGHRFFFARDEIEPIESGAPS